MAGEATKTCNYNITNYLAKVDAYNESDGGIDAKESEELFNIANACGPTQSGDDQIQYLYWLMTGMPNDAFVAANDPCGSHGGVPADIDPEIEMHLSIDSRPMSPQVFASFNPDQHSYFSAYDRSCLNFDETPTPRDSVCTVEGMPTTTARHPLIWKDGMPPVFMQKRMEVEAAANMGNDSNWRILRAAADDELCIVLGKEKAHRILDAGLRMSEKEALDILRTGNNLFLPHLTIDAMTAALNTANNYWDELNIAYDILDALITNKNIDSETKLFYGAVLESMMMGVYDGREDKWSGGRLGHISNDSVQKDFRDSFEQTYQAGFKPLVASKWDIAWKNWRGMVASPFGLGAGVLGTTSIFSGRAFTIWPTLIKNHWRVLPALVAAAPAGAGMLGSVGAVASRVGIVLGIAALVFIGGSIAYYRVTAGTEYDEHLKQTLKNRALPQRY